MPHTVIVPVCLTVSADTPSLCVYSEPGISSVIRASQQEQSSGESKDSLQNTSYIMRPTPNIHTTHDHRQAPHDSSRLSSSNEGD